MTILERESQILRVRAQGIHPELSEQLSETLRLAVVSTLKTVIEGALQEEVTAFLAQIEGEKPQRSGYYGRGLNTQYGSIEDLQVPKLRHRNGEREWQILERYQRSLGNRLALRPICHGSIVAGSSRSLIFSIRSRFIGECRESNYPSSSTKISRKTAISDSGNPLGDSGGWGVGGYSVCESG
jgi:Transposase, Mutator family